MSEPALWASRTLLIAGSQLLQQPLRVFQIARVEPLSEPPVNRSKEFARLLHLALVAPEACLLYAIEFGRRVLLSNRERPKSRAIGVSKPDRGRYPA